MLDTNKVLFYPFVLAQRESLEQLVWTHVYPVFWYEVSVLARDPGGGYRQTWHVENSESFPKLVHMTVHHSNYYLVRQQGVLRKTFMIEDFV
jgi:hypothetical protein